MDVSEIILLILFIYGISFYFSPFPYWPTYIILWKKVLFSKEQAINNNARRRQILFLLKYAALNPLWTLLWYLDDIIFAGYKRCRIRPVFIIGSPRSGTTFLHRTLGADEESFFAVRHMEWRYPYISLQKILQHSKLANKLMRTNYWPNTSEGSIAAKMHPNTLSDWEEDGIFFEECFLHHLYIILWFPYKELMPYLEEFPALPPKDQDKLLNAHKKVIQKIMYLRNGDNKFFLSKEVAGHNKIESLMRLYPDARFIVIGRHSGDYMPSLLELFRYSVLTKTGVDPKTIPGFEPAFIERMRVDNLFLVDLCNDIIKPEVQVRITFYHFSSNIIDSVNYLYRALNLHVGQTYLQYLEELQNSQKNRSRGYDYHKQNYLGFEKFDEFVSTIEDNIQNSINKYHYN